MSNIGEFRAALKAQSQQLAADAATELGRQAQALANAIREKAPVRSGALRQSVEAVQISPTRWRVRAGGSLTTKEVRAGSGQSYDYALATEFGTTKEAAEPFFYPTYRSRKRGIVKSVTDAASKSIA